MERINAREVYLKAQSLGHREVRDLESRGLSPYPAVLEEVFPAASHASGIALPIVEIPAERIIGTVSAGRTGVFSSSFLPLPDAGSEFASKWIAIPIASLIFAVMHGDLLWCAYAFVSGLVLTWMYFRCKSILPCISFHIAFNAANYLWAKLLPLPDAEWAYLLSFGLGFAIFALFLIVDAVKTKE